MNFACQKSTKNSNVYTDFRNCSWSIQMKVYLSGHKMWNISHITGYVFFSCLAEWKSRNTAFSFLALDAIRCAAMDLGIWYAMFWTISFTEIFYFSKALRQKDINTAYLPYGLQLKRHSNSIQSSWSDRNYNSFWKEDHQRSLRSDIVRKTNFPRKTKFCKQHKGILINQAT